MALNAYTIYGAPLVQQKSPSDSLDVEIVLDDGQEEEQSTRLLERPLAKTRFVPAQGEYDELGRLKSGLELLDTHQHKQGEGSDVGSWYSSLPRTSAPGVTSSFRENSKPPESSGVISEIQRPVAAIQAPQIPPSPVQGQQTAQAPRKRDWFSLTSNQRLESPASSSTSLAEMLRRDPPNPSNPHIPPVHYGIAPTNRGYSMLSRVGWEEGTPLGAEVHRRSMEDAANAKSRHENGKSKGKEKEKKERWMVLDDSLPKLLAPRADGTGVDIIDLTSQREAEKAEEGPSESDSDDYEDEDSPFHSHADEASPQQRPRGQASATSTAILTPIPVVLKHDRKGLGLSKSKRLVSHSSLAMKHHAQQAAIAKKYQVTEAKRLEREGMRGVYGRGKRAWARKAKEEQRTRDRLMEYMGS